MTDPKTLQGLARIVRDPWLNLANCQKEQVATALDCYARILAASPDVREIEERNQSAIAEVEALDPLAGIVVTRAQKDCATLLDVVRRKDAEIERLTAPHCCGKMVMEIARQRNEQNERADTLQEELNAARAESEIYLHSSRQALIAFEKVKEKADRLARIISEAAPLSWVGGDRFDSASDWERKASAALREHGALVAGEDGKKPEESSITS